MTGVWAQPMAWERVARGLADSRLNRVRGRGHRARPTLTLAARPVCSKSPWTVMLPGGGAHFLPSLRPTFQMASTKHLLLQNTVVAHRRTVHP